MLNLSPEMEKLGAAPAALARERREVFSLFPELRAMSWAGAILIATGAGVLLSKNLDRVGPVVLASAVFVAAAAAYGYAIWRKRSARTSLVDEYVLLLGALLLSADLAYIEGQFHLLDHGWPRHLLLLALLHAAGAYYFGSRTLLTLSLTALAAWMGIERRVDAMFDSNTETAIRAMVTAAMILLWRAADAKWRGARAASPANSFERVFEHAGANVALAGAMILVFQDSTRFIGTLIVLAFAALTMWHGFRVRAESFVIYAYAYAAVAVLIFGADLIGVDELILLFLIVASIAAIAGLFFVHNEFRRRKA
jgi:hypothetical protein